MITNNDDEQEFINNSKIGYTRFVPLNGIPTKIIIFDTYNNNQPNVVSDSSDHSTTFFDYDNLILMISGKLLVASFGAYNSIII